MSRIEIDKLGAPARDVLIECEQRTPTPGADCDTDAEDLALPRGEPLPGFTQAFEFVVLKVLVLQCHSLMLFSRFVHDKHGAVQG